MPRAKIVKTVGLPIRAWGRSSRGEASPGFTSGSPPGQQRFPGVPRPSSARNPPPLFVPRHARTTPGTGVEGHRAFRGDARAGLFESFCVAKRSYRNTGGVEGQLWTSPHRSVPVGTLGSPHSPPNFAQISLAFTSNSALHFTSNALMLRSSSWFLQQSNGPRNRCCQSKGRRGQDHDRHQLGRILRGC